MDARMNPAPLKILCVSQMPASPPRCGAQARMHGLMTQLARRHHLTAVVLVDESFDIDECGEAMRAYCHEVVLVPNPHAHSGVSKRLLQLRSIASTQSFERLIVSVPALQDALDRILQSETFDIVNLEFSFLGNFELRQAPPGCKPPALVVASHNIDYDLARQYARAGSLPRRLYAGVNWRKLRREELATYGSADGVSLCSEADERRLLDEIPGIRSLVIPNAADVEYYRPSSTASSPGDGTVVFFGLLSYFPNIDAVTYFVQEIWPRITEVNPQARLKIIGGQAPPAIQALSGQGIEVTGFVSDLRPHLATASAVVVPLRFGGGTRLKIVEAMAMGTAIVSTSLGAEGIDAVPGRDLLIEDEPAGFARAVNRLLSEAGLAANLGRSARQLAVQRYAWSAAASSLENFYRDILDKSSGRVQSQQGQRGGASAY
jgi:glycosyltransferase involved in cell wall biosynthesis